jgi:NAD-dependent SIR2 family protein deacetylase
MDSSGQNLAAERVTARDSERQREGYALALDAFVRSIGVRRSSPHALFLGAGASISSGIPSAQACIWEWKRHLFLTNNPGLEDQFSELSLPSVKQRVQDWLDAQGTFPLAESADEYGFYISQCFPIPDDRRAFFEERVRTAQPHIGYRLICHLAQADVVRSVWSTNFDGLASRAAASFQLTPLEVGIDTQGRLARTAGKGELLCVSLHGDYRYDDLKNTSEELRRQEELLRSKLIEEIRARPIIVCGYSGRDHSIMEALHAACNEAGRGALYWCGFSDGDMPDEVGALLAHARANGKQAFYVPSLGFDDLMTRLALHCLEGDVREAARTDIHEHAPEDLLDRKPFEVAEFARNTLIKSNAFEIECPAEVLSFEIKEWPKEKVWAWVREQTERRALVAAPFKSRILALGTVDDVKDAFGENIQGLVERLPVSPHELRFEDGAIVSLMREALVRSMAESAALNTDGRRELWLTDTYRTEKQANLSCRVYESVRVYLRRIGDKQYVVLKPSLNVLDNDGNEVPREISGPVKLRILGYQHNKPFNQAVNKWRGLLFPKDAPSVFEFPMGVGSSFKFRVRRSPIFGQIGLPQGGRSVQITDRLRPLLKHKGLQLVEPLLVFRDKQGKGTVTDTHPIRGIVANKPYDYPLTLGGLAPNLRVGVICAETEASLLRSYLQKCSQTHRPEKTEQDYLVDYPGFQQAFDLPIEIPEPGQPGWVSCAEPTGANIEATSVSVAHQITRSLEVLRSSYAPHVAIIFFPERWEHFRGYKIETEKFDVHDFVKAYKRSASSFSMRVTGCLAASFCTSSYRFYRMNARGCWKAWAESIQSISWRFSTTAPCAM